MSENDNPHCGVGHDKWCTYCGQRGVRQEAVDKEKWGAPYTFGDSQAAINLMGDILTREEFQGIRPRVLRILSKQSGALKSLMVIQDKSIRETCLLVWHERFISKVESLPEVIQTHMRCVETGMYRKLLKESARK